MARYPKKSNPAYSLPEYIRNRDIIRVRDRGVCVRCHVLFGLYTPGKECDHFVPLCRGGTNAIDSMWLLCKPCHQSKSSWELVDGRSGFTPTIDPATGFDVKEPDWQEIIRERTVAYLSRL